MKESERMSTFSYSIQTSFVLFPIVALVFTLPYILFQYHKYGSVNPYRSMVVYSFLLYLMSAYFLVILPLPSVETVSKMTTPSYNLIPFHFVSEILNKTNFHVSDFATYFPAMKNPVFYEALFNIVLTVPFGVYLHYYFKCDFKHTLFYSFCFSLFFELTQMTGLYYIYPRSYRVFDVDDLILNTLGGVVGFLFSCLLLKILPTREEIDKKSFEKGKKVSIVRRLLSFLIDITFFGLTLFCITYLLKQYHFLSQKLFVLITFLLCIIYFVCLPVLLHKKTIGMKFLQLEFQAKKETIKWYQYLAYYSVFILEYVILPLLFLAIGYILYQTKHLEKSAWEYFSIIIVALTLMIYNITFLKRIFNMKTFYESITRMTIISSIGKTKRE